MQVYKLQLYVLELGDVDVLLTGKLDKRLDFYTNGCHGRLRLSEI